MGATHNRFLRTSLGSNMTLKYETTFFSMSEPDAVSVAGSGEGGTLCGCEGACWQHLLLGAATSTTDRCCSPS